MSELWADDRHMSKTTGPKLYEYVQKMSELWADNRSKIV